MKPSFSLGRVAGIKLGANWSVVVIVWLITWSLASYLPQEYPGWLPGVYWLIATLTSATFFASLLAHELAHSLVAARAGIAVDSITLWIFGGVSRLRAEASTPSVEIKVALVGPATSFLLACAFLLVGIGVDAFFDPSPITAAIEWLARVNLMLAIFNLIPALPLDGGRLLHALLWKRRDATSATVIAARIGRGFAFTLMGLGAFLWMGGNDPFGGLWLVLIGWFIAGAAGAEALHSRARSLLEGVEAREAMNSGVVIVRSDASVEALLMSASANPESDTFLAIDDLGEATGVVMLARPEKIASASSPRRVVDLARPLSEFPQAQTTEALADVLARIGDDTDRILVRDPSGVYVGVITPASTERALQRAALRRSIPPQLVSTDRAA